jgi:hypothetical protein
MDIIALNILRRDVKLNGFLLNFHIRDHRP